MLRFFPFALCILFLFSYGGAQTPTPTPSGTPEALFDFDGTVTRISSSGGRETMPMELVPVLRPNDLLTLDFSRSGSLAIDDRDGFKSIFAVFIPTRSTDARIAGNRIPIEVRRLVRCTPSDPTCDDASDPQQQQACLAKCYFVVPYDTLPVFFLVSGRDNFLQSKFGNNTRKQINEIIRTGDNRDSFLRFGGQTAEFVNTPKKYAFLNDVSAVLATPAGKSTKFLQNVYESTFQYFGIKTDGCPLEEQNNSPSLAQTDLVNAKKLVLNLKTKGTPISKFLGESLTEPNRKLLEAYDPTKEPEAALITGLITDLNRIITGTSIHDASRFSKVKLSERTKQLLAKSPVGDEVHKLNRMLLNDAYPNEIKNNYRPSIELSAAQLQCILKRDGDFSAVTDAVAKQGLDWSSFVIILSNTVVAELKFRFPSVGPYLDIAVAVYSIVKPYLEKWLNGDPFHVRGVVFERSGDSLTAYAMNSATGTKKTGRFRNAIFFAPFRMPLPKDIVQQSTLDAFEPSLSSKCIKQKQNLLSFVPALLGSRQISNLRVILTDSSNSGGALTLKIPATELRSGIPLELTDAEWQEVTSWEGVRGRVNYRYNFAEHQTKEFRVGISKATNWRLADSSFFRVGGNHKVRLLGAGGQACVEAISIVSGSAEFSIPFVEDLGDTGRVRIFDKSTKDLEIELTDQLLQALPSPEAKIRLRQDGTAQIERAVSIEPEITVKGITFHNGDDFATIFFGGAVSEDHAQTISKAKLNGVAYEVVLDEADPSTKFKIQRVSTAIFSRPDLTLSLVTTAGDEIPISSKLVRVVQKQQFKTRACGNTDADMGEISSVWSDTSLSAYDPCDIIPATIPTVTIGVSPHDDYANLAARGPFIATIWAEDVERSATDECRVPNKLVRQLSVSPEGPDLMTISFSPDPDTMVFLGKCPTWRLRLRLQDKHRVNSTDMTLMQPIGFLPKGLHYTCVDSKCSLTATEYRSRVDQVSVSGKDSGFVPVDGPLPRPADSSQVWVRLKKTGTIVRLKPEAVTLQ